MEIIKSLTLNVINDISGTTRKLLFVKVSPAEKHGRDFILKIGEMTYSSHQRERRSVSHAVQTLESKFRA